MKNVLIIGVTECRLDDPHSNTVKKFKPLSGHINLFVLGRGRPFRKDKFGASFYLINGRLIFFPAAFLVGSFLCLNKKIDTIVCQSPLTEGAVGVLLKYFFRKKFIVEVHGDWREGPFLNKKRFLTPISKKVVSVVGFWVLRNADGIRTLTRTAKHEIKSILPQKQYFVFPTFTDIDIFLQEQDRHFKDYILTVAVLSPIKNIEILIEAFAKIQKEFPRFKLIIVGDGPSRESLGRMADKLLLGKGVIFTGRLPLYGVKEVMKDCYALILPSLNEGFGRVFIEAMALGKPVLGSNAGGIPDVIKDNENGLLFKAGDSKDLQNKIRILLSNKEMAQNMGRNGREFVKNNFSNEKYVENYASMINS